MAKAKMTSTQTVSPHADKVLHLGCDLASSGVKLAYELNGEIKTVITDSILATTSERNLGEYGRAVIKKLMGYQPTNGATPDVLRHNGVANIIGAGAEKFVDPYQPIAQSRFLDGADLLKLLLVAISKTNPAPHQQISLELSLPVNAIKTIQEDVLRQSIGQWLLGNHRYEVNNVAYEVDIVHFDYAEQPIHAVIGMCMNRDGTWISQYSQEAAITMIDLGGFSVDSTWVQKFQVDYERTKGDALGFYVAAEGLADTLQDLYGVSFSSFEAAKLLRSYAEGDEVNIMVGEFSYQVTKEAAQSFDKMATKLMEFCRKSITAQQAKASIVVLVGGPAGLPSLAKKFRNEYPKLVVVPDRFLSAKGALLSEIWNSEE